jgi:UDPglucose 6-dehydrogenase
MQDSRERIGFVGQGYVGKNYADYFENAGFDILRYSLEEPYRNNKDQISDCDIVFIAVPTPTTPEGFDFSIVREAIALVGKGKIAVIKSTITPGTTKKLQEEFPDCTVAHSPEFLREVSAAEDVSNAFASIVGLGLETPEHRKAGERVLAIMPTAPVSIMCSGTEAEVMKYTHNVNCYLQIVFSNIMYDFVAEHGQSWDALAQFVKANPYMHERYLQPIHQDGRGAGGNCFVKDFAAFHRAYARALPDDHLTDQMLDAVEKKNIELLKNSGKSLHILKQVYGDS